jgi:hypothetical protein
MTHAPLRINEPRRLKACDRPHVNQLRRLERCVLQDILHTDGERARWRHFAHTTPSLFAN